MSRVRPDSSNILKKEESEVRAKTNAIPLNICVRHKSRAPRMPTVKMPDWIRFTKLRDSIESKITQRWRLIEVKSTLIQPYR